MRFMRLAHPMAETMSKPMVEDMLGTPVFDSSDKPIGMVDDLLAYEDNPDAIDYALVGKGNITDMLSGRDLIVPLDRLDIDADKKVAHLDIALDQLRDFSSYDTLQDPGLKDKVDSFWASMPKAMAA